MLKKYNFICLFGIVILWLFPSCVTSYQDMLVLFALLRLDKKLFILPVYVLKTYFYVVAYVLCNVSLNTPIACSLVCFPGMTSSLAIVNKSLSGAFSKIS